MSKSYDEFVNKLGSLEEDKQRNIINLFDAWTMTKEEADNKSFSDFFDELYNTDDSVEDFIQRLVSVSAIPRDEPEPERPTESFEESVDIIDQQRIDQQKIEDLTFKLAMMVREKRSREIEVEKLRHEDAAAAGAREAALYSRIDGLKDTLKEQEEINRESIAKIAEYAGEMNRMKEQLEAAERYNKEVNERVEDLETSIINNTDRSDSTITGLEARLDSTRTEADQLRKEMKLLQGMLIQQGALLEDRSQLMLKNEALSKEILGLKADLESVLAQKSKPTAPPPRRPAISLAAQVGNTPKLSENKERIDELERRIKELTNINGEQARTIDALELQNAGLGRENVAQAVKVEAQVVTIAAQATRVKELEDQMAAQAVTIAAQASKIAALEANQLSQSPPQQKVQSEQREDNTKVSGQLTNLIDNIALSYKGSAYKKKALFDLAVSVGKLSDGNDGNFSKAEIKEIFRLLTNITLQKQSNSAWALWNRNTTTSGEQLRALINTAEFKDLKQHIANPDNPNAFTGDLKYRNLRSIGSKGTNDELMNNEPFVAKGPAEVSQKFAEFKIEIDKLKQGKDVVADKVDDASLSHNM